SMAFRTWFSGVSLTLVIAGCGGTTPTPSTAAPASSTAATTSGGALDALYQQAKTEGQVVWNSSQQDSIFQPVIEAFQKTYPGIKVGYSQAGADSVAKIQIQQAAKKVEVDVGNVAELNL